MTPLEAAVPGRRAGRTHYGRKATAVCPAQPGVARNGARLIVSSNAGHQAHPDVETADFRTSKCLDVGGTVQRRLGLDPVDGHLYLFMNKRRRIAKALWFDGSGWCVLAKRLESGSFQLPSLDTSQPQVQIDGSMFASLLAGIDFTAARQGWYRRAAPRSAR